MKRHRINLTGIGSVLTESAEKKIEEGESIRTPVCDNGRTSEFYDDLGMTYPKELEERLNNFDKGVKLEDDDFEEVYTDIVVYADEIKLMVTDEELTTIFLKDNLTLTVTETAEDIDAYLDYLELSWFDKILIFFRGKLGNKENNL